MAEPVLGATASFENGNTGVGEGVPGLPLFCSGAGRESRVGSGGLSLHSPYSPPETTQVMAEGHPGLISLSHTDPPAFQGLKRAHP